MSESSKSQPAPLTVDALQATVRRLRYEGTHDRPLTWLRMHPQTWRGVRDDLERAGGLYPDPTNTESRFMGHPVEEDDSLPTGRVDPVWGKVGQP